MRLCKGRLRGLDLGGQPGQRLVERQGPRFLARLVAAEAFEPVAGGGHSLVEREGGGAGGLHRLLGDTEGFGRGLERGLGLVERGLAGVDLRFQLGQAGALGEADGGRAGGLGALDEAVPAPQVARDSDQTGSDRQGFRQPLDLTGRGHTAEGEAGLQLVGGGDMGGQRLDAGRPDGGGHLCPGPPGGCPRIQRRIQIVAEGRSQCRLIALVGLHPVQRRRILPSALHQQLG